MNHKLNGWNNNLTPFDGVGGKPGYHEKIPTMTPEQKKAKEIVEKYREIILSKVEGSGEMLAAKACAIEEVDGILEILVFDLGHDQTARKCIEYYEKVLTEIEKL